MKSGRNEGKEMKKMNASEKTTRKTQNSQPSHTLLTHTIETTHLIVRALSFLERLRERKREKIGKKELREIQWVASP